MKNLCNLVFKLVNSLLKKFVLWLPVTNYHFAWCSVVINVIFNTCFGSTNCHKGKSYFRDLLVMILNLVGGNCMRLLLQDRFFFQIMNYEGF
jgi:hypothetical protein